MYCNTTLHNPISLKAPVIRVLIVLTVLKMPNTILFSEKGVRGKNKTAPANHGSHRFAHYPLGAWWPPHDEDAIEGLSDSHSRPRFTVGTPDPWAVDPEPSDPLERRLIYPWPWQNQGRTPSITGRSISEGVGAMVVPKALVDKVHAVSIVWHEHPDLYRRRGDHWISRLLGYVPVTNGSGEIQGTCDGCDMLSPEGWGFLTKPFTATMWWQYILTRWLCHREWPDTVTQVATLEMLSQWETLVALDAIHQAYGQMSKGINLPPSYRPSKGGEIEDDDRVPVEVFKPHGYLVRTTRAMRTRTEFGVVRDTVRYWQQQR